ncbi:MAG: DEAD/DEAH box helicase family protein [Quinella sp. 1Q7]|nr:DEAD/DEAH box helicase family protein [Quinella sp. 1Q7]
MILKDYQQRAIDDLAEFLRRLTAGNSIKRAFAEFWLARDVRAEAYQNTIANVPQVCFKVPTGGGKTFMAAASLRVIFDELPAQNKFVVWLVPSETILAQTYKNLSDAAHPYRRRLEADFGGQVAVYGKEQLLAGENFSPAEVAAQLTVAVLSYDSFRTSNKDGRRAYRQNGQLNQFVANFAADEKLLPDADESSLVSVIRHYKPVVIVDESHHAATTLSVDMLRNFNPRFILELTATPRTTSNVIAYVPAAKLKSAAMVKLPVIVYNRRSRDDVIADAITFRELLERVGRAEGVRPIVLFQAETQGKGDRATFDRIKADLITNHAIPAEQIAVKTADINDLRGVDLLAADCPVRYIITINALKEGWDCPFAYVLASLANRTSEIDVEQILGRILRRPFTKNFSDALLNQSYVFTSSADFQATLDKIVTGLNSAGFSRRECRIADDLPTTDFTPPAQGNIFQPPPTITKPTSATNTAPENFSADMEAQARQFGDAYATDISDGDIRSEEELTKMTVFKMRDRYRDALNLQLPQFHYVEDAGDLFGNDEPRRVNIDWLLKNFTLADKDTVINFDNLRREVASFDVHGDDDFLSRKFLSDAELKNFLEHFDELAPPAQIRQCAEKITTVIDRRRKLPPTQDITAYVKRIVETFSREQIRDAVINTEAYADRIRDKINAMQTVHAASRFNALIDARKIFAAPSYTLPAEISPPTFNRWSNSLYEAEESVNGWEFQIAAALSKLDNVHWWHRNRAQKEFCLNGFINHYPDFIVRMKSGVTLLVEAKGDDRDNSDSRHKLTLGKIWEAKSGADKFGYFMVFDKNPIDGALRLDEFISRVGQL